MLRHQGVVLLAVVGMSGVLLAPGAEAQPTSPFTLKTAINSTSLGTATSSISAFEVTRKSILSGSTSLKTTLQTQGTKVVTDAKSAQMAITPVITEFKKDGKWTTSFDTYVESALRAGGADSRFLQFMKDQGGARAIMEKVAATQAITDLQSYVDGAVAAAKDDDDAPSHGPSAPLGGGCGSYPTASSFVCFRCHCLWYAAAAAVLMTVPGGQPAALGAAAGGLACATAVT